jgi:hypothetical protein
MTRLGRMTRWPREMREELRACLVRAFKAQLHGHNLEGLRNLDGMSENSRPARREGTRPTGYAHNSSPLQDRSPDWANFRAGSRGRASSRGGNEVARVRQSQNKLRAARFAGCLTLPRRQEREWTAAGPGESQKGELVEAPSTVGQQGRKGRKGQRGPDQTKSNQIKPVRGKNGLGGAEKRTEYGPSNRAILAQASQLGQIGNKATRSQNKLCFRRRRGFRGRARRFGRFGGQVGGQSRFASSEYEALQRRQSNQIKVNQTKSNQIKPAEVGMCPEMGHTVAQRLVEYSPIKPTWPNSVRPSQSRSNSGTRRRRNKLEAARLAGCSSLPKSQSQSSPVKPNGSWRL